MSCKPDESLCPDESRLDVSDLNAGSLQLLLKAQNRKINIFVRLLL
jgi:hypothetical protein